MRWQFASMLLVGITSSFANRNDSTLQIAAHQQIRMTDKAYCFMYTALTRFLHERHSFIINLDDTIQLSMMSLVPHTKSVVHIDKEQPDYTPWIFRGNTTCLFNVGRKNRYDGLFIEDTLQFLIRWGRTCHTIVVLETEKHLDYSVSNYLQNYIYQKSVTSIMVNMMENTINVHSFQYDCVRLKPIGTQISFNSTRNIQVPSKIHLDQKIALRGSTLRISTTSFSPHIFVYLDNGVLTGVDINVIECVAEEMGFNLIEVQQKTVPGVSKSLFRRLPNGTMLGIVGEVANGDADIAMGNAAITAERRGVAECTFEYDVANNGLLGTWPEPESKLLLAIKPFTLGTWILVICTIALMIVIFTFYPGIKRRNEKTKTSQFTKSVFFLFGEMTEQSVELNPETTSSRFLVIIFALLFMAITKIYSSQLTARLFSVNYPSLITNLQQLAESRFDVFIMQGVSLVQYFESLKETDSSLSAISYRINFLNLEDSWVTVELRPKAAYINDYYYLQFILNQRRDKERYYLTKMRFFSAGLGFYMRNGACFADKISSTLLWVTSSGLITYWIKEFEEKISKPVEGNRALTLRNLAVAFLVLGIGFTFAFISFILEFVTKKTIHTKNKNRK